MEQVRVPQLQEHRVPGAARGRDPRAPSAMGSALALQVVLLRNGHVGPCDKGTAGQRSSASRRTDQFILARVGEKGLPLLGLWAGLSHLFQENPV